MFHQFDISRDGRISYSEFFNFLTISETNSSAILTLVKTKLKTFFKNENKMLSKEIFYKIDKNGDGMISKEELQSGLGEMGLILTEDEITAVFNDFDKDKSNSISYEEMMDSLVPNYFGFQQNIDDIVFRLKMWINQNQYTVLTLKQSLSNFYKGDATNGIPRRTFRLFLSHMNIPIEEKDWKYLMEEFSCHWDTNKVNIEEFIKKICGKSKEVFISDEDKEIKQEIRRTVSTKGIEYSLTSEFIKYDPEISHRVKIVDFKQIMSNIQAHLSIAQINYLTNKFDPSFSGYIFYHDFLNYINLNKEESENIIELIQQSVTNYIGNINELFKRFDFNNNGRVSYTDIKYIFKTLEIEISDFELINILKPFIDPEIFNLILYPLLLTNFSSNKGNNSMNLLNQSVALNASMNKTRFDTTMIQQRNIDNTTQYQKRELLSQKDYFVDRENYNSEYSKYQKCGIYSCPICFYEQRTAYNDQCEMCFTTNPYKFDYDVLVYCNNCSYTNPPKNTFCELCHTKLPAQLKQYVPTRIAK